MGKECLVVNGHLLDLISVKNTFIHVGEDCDVPAKSGLVRCLTDPTPGAAQAHSPRSSNGASCSDGYYTTDSENAFGDDFKFDETTTVGDDLENDGAAEQEDVDEQGQAPANAMSAQRTSWFVCAKRLRGKDTRLSQSRLLTVGHSEQEFVITLYPLVTSKRRGCGCFAACKGLGVIHVKCSKPIDAELSLTVTVGGEQSESQVHNFARESVCKFSTEWQFQNFLESEAQSIEVAAPSLEIGLEVSLNSLTLTSFAVCKEELNFIGTDGELEQESAPAFDQVDAVLLYLQEPPCWQHGASAELLPITEHDFCSEFLPMAEDDSFGANAEVKFVYMYCEPQSQPQTEMWCSGGDPQPCHEVRDGDWYCLNCGDFQFGRNSECRICGEPKPKPAKELSTGQPQMYAAVLYPIDGSGNINAGCPMACVVPVIADVGTQTNQALANNNALASQTAHDGDEDAPLDVQTGGEKKSRRRRRRRAGKGTHKDTWDESDNTWYSQADDSWRDDSWNSWDDKADSSGKWKDWAGWNDWSESYRENKWKPCSA